LTITETPANGQAAVIYAAAAKFVVAVLRQ
jgi:hypothetical protein